MNDRRKVLGAAMALGLASLPARSLASGPAPIRGSGAPGPTAVALALRSRPLGLHAGSHGGLDAPRAIHLNFARLVEYNLARLAPQRFSALWHDLTPAETTALAQLYDQSAQDAGGSPRLLAIVAERASIEVLGRVAGAFGVERVFSATASAAPEKLPALAAAFSAGAGSLPGPAVVATTSGPTIDYTLHEIYLSYRTAPVGSLSVPSSIYMTARYAAPQLLLAWGTGYGAGRVMAPLVERYAPSLWTAIGSTVHHTIELLGRTYDSLTTALYERQAAIDFRLSGQPFFELQGTGGDFGVVWNWHIVYGGGSSGGGGGGGGGGDRNPFCAPLSWCPPTQAN